MIETAEKVKMADHDMGLVIAELSRAPRVAVYGTHADGQRTSRRPLWYAPYGMDDMDQWVASERKMTKAVVCWWDRMVLHEQMKQKMEQMSSGARKE